MERFYRNGGCFALLLFCFLEPFSPSPAQAQTSAAADHTSIDAGKLDEIVVTARRRTESLQLVPVSVVTLSEAELESRSVTSLRTLQNFVPNLTFAPSQNVGEAAGNIFIRGVGQEDFGVGAEPGVGFYVDGVYFARPLGTIMNVTDVARIEVLRGPQGTLFGKNTIGGAINIVSVMPREESERRASIIIGNLDRVELRTVANEMLSDRLLARLSLVIVDRDGYLRRVPPSVSLASLETVNRAPVNLAREGDDRNQAGRLQLRWLISGKVTADLSLDGSRRRDRQSATHTDAINPNGGILPLLNQLIAEGTLPGPQITAGLAPNHLLESRATGRNSTKQELWGAAATISADLGGSTLKFIGAYRGLRTHVGSDIDGLHFDIAETDFDAKQRQLSGELQLTGTLGALTYTGGVFVFRERSEILPTIPSLSRVLYTCGCLFSPSRLAVEPRQLRTNNDAVYAQGNFRIMDQLGVTLGVRYSHERKEIEAQAFRVDADFEPTDEQIAAGSNRGTWSPFTYRAGVEYHATPDLMLYGSAASGYKSGGFNSRTTIGLPNLGLAAFKPETALTYEVGIRSQWLDRRLRFNATLFHAGYKDIQLRQQDFSGGVLITLIQNAAKARIRGAEVDLSVRPIQGLTLNVAYGHLDTRYLDVGTVSGLTLDTPFQRTPRHSFTASAHYERPLRSGTLELHADYSYRSKEQFQMLAAFNDQRGYGLLGARATFRAADDRWSFALFSTNLTDERYRTAGRDGLQQIGIAYSSIGLPRQVGIQLAAKF